MKKLTNWAAAAIAAAVFPVLIVQLAFGAGFFEQGTAPAGGYPSSPTFTHVGTASVTATDNASGNGTGDLKNWRDAFINRNMSVGGAFTLGGLPVVASENAAYFGGKNLGTPNYTDNAYLYRLRTKAGPVVEADVFGFDPGASGAVNKSAVDNAVAFAKALGSGGIRVHLPGGAYNWTGTLNTDDVQIYGDGPQRTKLFPTTSVKAISMTLNHGWSGDFSIDYTNAGTIDSNAIGVGLDNVSQCAIGPIVVWNGYHGFATTHYVWKLDLIRPICSGNKDYCIKIDDSNPSTTVNILHPHAYGGDNTGKGYYLNNVVSGRADLLSMDGGESTDGSLLTIKNGNQFRIDAIHHENFHQLTGYPASTNAPIVFSGMLDLGGLFTAAHNVDVGGGNSSYYFKCDYPAKFRLGNYVELGPVITSGTKKVGIINGCVSADLPYSYGTQSVEHVLTRDDFLSTSTGQPPTDGVRYHFASDTFWDAHVKQFIGSTVSLDNSAFKTLIAFTPFGSASHNGGFFIVKGQNTSLGQGFTDIIIIATAINGSAVVVVVSSGNSSGLEPARTYQYDNVGDNIQAKIASGAFNTWAYGTGLSAANP